MTCMNLQHSRSYNYTLFGFKLSKLEFRGHNLFDGFFKGIKIKCIIDEAGVWWMQPMKVCTIIVCKL